MSTLSRISIGLHSILLSDELFFTLTNSVDPEGMPHY